MTPREIALVNETLASLGPLTDRATAALFARLFELDPGLRRHFRGDLSEHGRRLLTQLGLVTASLAQPARFRAVVRELSLHPTVRAMRDEHYVTIGAALLWTLEENLGSAFTPEVRTAWMRACGILANAMIDAAHAARSAAARSDSPLSALGSQLSLLPIPCIP